MVSLVTLFVLPVTVAHAGFFSFVGDLFDRGTVIFTRASGGNQEASVLKAAVNPDPNPSKGGGGIVILDNTALKADSGPLGAGYGTLDGATAPKSDQISIYVVREGDNLSQIAEMFGVTMKTIMWANDIGSRGTIHPGDVLVILPVSGVKYSVKSGDTISSIAKKFDAESEEILEFNGIDSASSLTVGTEIIIPGGTLIDQTPPKYASGGSVTGTRVPSYDGYYLRPVGGGVKTQGLHGYNAVDIAASVGTPILASASGEVVLSKYAEGNPWFGGYGNYIVIKHNNGTQTVYAHLSDNLVRRGWKVVQGQVIGYMGSTGRSTGSHLHFEIRGAKNPF